MSAPSAAARYWLQHAGRYRADPAAFAREILQVDLWQKQIEVLEAVRDHDRIVVPSGHGVSKTHTAACVVIWFIYCFVPSKVVTTAPSGRQVRDLLWSEIRSLVRGAKYPLGGQLDLVRWTHSDDHFAVGLTTRPDDISDAATRFQGYHSPHLLVVVDEAAGLDPAIHEAIDGLLTSATVRVLEIGNPTGSSGPFVDHIKSPRYHTIRIDCEESPNVVAGKVVRPYLVTKEWVDDMAEKWGRDHPIYKSRVRGLVPEQATNALVSFAWVNEAFSGAREPILGPRSMGIDVARYGDDSTVIYIVEGSRILERESWVGQDTTKTAGRAAWLAEHYDIKPHMIAVDDTGVGGGVTDQLRNNHMISCVAENFAAQAHDTNEFYNRRSEIWWALAQWIKNEASLSDAPASARANLSQELPAPTYDTDRGKIRLEPKEKIKKRIGRSPDDADALALALAYRSAKPVVVAHRMRVGTEEEPARRTRTTRERVLAGIGAARSTWRRERARGRRP